MLAAQERFQPIEWVRSGEVKGRRGKDERKEGSEGKEGGEKKGREKGEEERRGYKVGKVKQFLWVNHSQHVRVVVFSNNWGEEEGEREKTGSISKGDRSFSMTYLVLNLAGCSQDARTQKFSTTKIETSGLTSYKLV